MPLFVFFCRHPQLGITDVEYADGPFGIREEMEPHSWICVGYVLFLGQYPEDVGK